MRALDSSASQLPDGRGSDQKPTPTDPASFTFVALDTRTPYTLDFDAADGGLPLTRRGGQRVCDRLPSATRLRRVKGKNAHYLLRWVNPTGEKGPWSETVSATITA